MEDSGIAIVTTDVIDFRQRVFLVAAVVSSLANRRELEIVQGFALGFGQDEQRALAIRRLEETLPGHQIEMLRIQDVTDEVRGLVARADAT